MIKRCALKRSSSCILTLFLTYGFNWHKTEGSDGSANRDTFFNIWRAEAIKLISNRKPSLESVPNVSNGFFWKFSEELLSCLYNQECFHFRLVELALADAVVANVTANATDMTGPFHLIAFYFMSLWCYDLISFFTFIHLLPYTSLLILENVTKIRGQRPLMKRQKDALKLAK